MAAPETYTFVVRLQMEFDNDSQEVRDLSQGAFGQEAAKNAILKRAKCTPDELVWVDTSTAMCTRTRAIFYVHSAEEVDPSEAEVLSKYL